MAVAEDAVVGVPEITPVVLSMCSPAGSPIAVKVNGEVPETVGEFAAMAVLVT